MSGLLDLLNSPMGKTIISGVSGSTGQSEGSTGKLLSMAMPVLMTWLIQMIEMSRMI